MLQLVSTSSSASSTTSEAFIVPSYSFSGGLNKSRSHYGGLGVVVEVDESTPSMESPPPAGDGGDTGLIRPLSVSRSHSAPHTSLTKEERIEFSLSPWLGIYRLLTHPAVNATEPDKQVSSTQQVVVTTGVGSY